MINDRVGPRLSPIRLRGPAEAPPYRYVPGSAAGAGVRGRGVVHVNDDGPDIFESTLRELPISLPRHMSTDDETPRESASPPVPTPRVCSTAEIPVIGTHSMTRLDDSIADLLAVDGALGVAVVDLDSGMVLAAGGNPGFDLEIVAAGNSNMLRAKLRTMNELGIGGGLEDMMITLDYQYHLINVLRDGGTAGLFIYFVLDRAAANLALARHKLRIVAGQVRV